MAGWSGLALDSRRWWIVIHQFGIKGPENWQTVCIVKNGKVWLQRVQTSQTAAQTPRVAHELMCNKRAKFSSGAAHDVIFYSCFSLFIVKAASSTPTALRCFTAPPNSSLPVCTKGEWHLMFYKWGDGALGAIPFCLSACPYRRRSVIHVLLSGRSVANPWVRKIAIGCAESRQIRISPELPNWSGKCYCNGRFRT